MSGSVPFSPRQRRQANSTRFYLPGAGHPKDHIDSEHIQKPTATFTKIILIVVTFRNIETLNKHDDDDEDDGAELKKGMRFFTK